MHDSEQYTRCRMERDQKQQRATELWPNAATMCHLSPLSSTMNCSVSSAALSWCRSVVLLTISRSLSSPWLVDVGWCSICVVRQWQDRSSVSHWQSWIQSPRDNAVSLLLSCMLQVHARSHSPRDNPVSLSLLTVPSAHTTCKYRSDTNFNISHINWIMQ